MTTLVDSRPSVVALHDTASVALGLAGFGVTLGVTMSALGIGVVPGLIGAAVVYGGSAQLTAVTLVHQGAAFVAVVVSSAIVNARLPARLRNGLEYLPPAVLASIVAVELTTLVHDAEPLDVTILLAAAAAIGWTAQRTRNLSLACALGVAVVLLLAYAPR